MVSFQCVLVLIEIENYCIFLLWEPLVLLCCTKCSYVQGLDFLKIILHDFSIFVPSTRLCTEFMFHFDLLLATGFYMKYVLIFFLFCSILILPSPPELSIVNVYI